MKTKLDKRLTDIFNLIDNSYAEIWDTCCDHGKLGLAILESKKTAKVHFLDQVPSIIQNLKLKLELIPDVDFNCLELHSKPAQEIELKEKSLVCICGVGGDIAIEIIRSIEENNPSIDVEFLMAAQYQVYDLRNFLIQNEYKSKKEIFTYQGKWNYEVLHVSKAEGLEIDPVGSNLFVELDERKRKYIQSLVSHYDKKSKREKSSSLIKESYEKLLRI